MTYPFETQEEFDSKFLQNVGDIPLYIHDGGRKEAGFEGDAKDCVVRAIAITLQKSYKQTWDDLYNLTKENKRYSLKKEFKNSFPKEQDESFIQEIIEQEVKKATYLPDKGVFVSYATEYLLPYGYDQYWFTNNLDWDLEVAQRIIYGQSLDINRPDILPKRKKRGRALYSDLLPDGNIILVMNKHLAACIDHNIFDTGTQLVTSKGRSRLVQGYLYATREKKERKLMNIKRDKRKKLTEEDVISIRSKYAAGAKLSVLSEEFHVSIQCIRNIVLRNTWSDLPDHLSNNPELDDDDDDIETVDIDDDDIASPYISLVS